MAVAVIALAGCSGVPGAGSDGTGTDPGVDVESNDTGATNVTQSVVIEVEETAEGEELSAIGATYPRDRFTVRAAQHDQIGIGVDSDGDGEVERRFNETNISGVNNNAYSFDVTLDTGYALSSGDTVVVEYPAVDNPTESGQYTVGTRLNDRPAANATVAIG